MNKKSILFALICGILSGLIGTVIVTRNAVRPVLTEETKQQIHQELRDPRLWSNIKGMVTGESPAERVAAHAKLRSTNGVLPAIKEGLSR
jgi:hypothetical protein